MPLAWSVVHDPLLGWVTNPGHRSPGRSINVQGIRGKRTFSREPVPGRIRLAAFGDSFTFCSGVADEESWSEILQNMRRGTEILNFGVGGYGVDQAFLRFQRDGIQYHPHGVIIGYASENLNRHVNSYRAFYKPKGMPYSKPRFQIQNGGLVLIPNYFSTHGNIKRFMENTEAAMRDMGRSDYFYKADYAKGAMDFLPSVRFFKVTHCVFRERWRQRGPNYVRGVYHPSSEAYQITLKLLDLFYRTVSARGAVPVIVLFPSKKDLISMKKGRPCSYAPLVRDLKKTGYDFIDLKNRLLQRNKGRPVQALFAQDGLHYGSQANREAAEALLEFFELKGILKTVRVPADLPAP